MLKLQEKCKIVFVYAMKAYRWNSGITPLILNLGTGWNRADSFTPPTTLPLGNEPQYPLNRTLFGCYVSDFDVVKIKCKIGGCISVLFTAVVFRMSHIGKYHQNYLCHCFEVSSEHVCCTCRLHRVFKWSVN